MGERSLVVANVTLQRDLGASGGASDHLLAHGNVANESRRSHSPTVSRPCGCRRPAAASGSELCVGL